jgi:imidazolonepropionase-like amidohydrolase
MKKLFFFVLIAFAQLSASAQKTFIHCGKLVDAKTAKLLTAKTIVVEGNKIVEVVDGFVNAGANDKTIDLKNSTVMPGLMDMHVHIEGENSPTKYLEEFTVNAIDYAYSAIPLAQKTLMSGFTSIRDLGGSGANIALRKAIQKGLVIGPRIYTAGKAIGTTGGHADPTNGYREDLMGDPGPKEGVINGPADAYKAVRQRYKEGSDVIKITASGGVLSMATNGQNSQFTDEELKAIVAAAKDYGFKVAAHSHGAEAMKRAIKAGVHSIEHGTLMDDEVYPLMKQHGTYLVATIIAGRSSADSAKIPGYYPPMITKKALEIGPKSQSNFARAYKEGVKIAFGTDAGVFSHGKNWLEFVYMTEAGMPILEAIQSATWNAADLMGTQNILGSIEANKLADIIAVNGDPTKDVKVMGQVNFVMKDGVVYKSNK